MNTPIDYLSRYSFRHFCRRVKQGKRSSEFLQKYTDSGTEKSHLAGYNILAEGLLDVTTKIYLKSRAYHPDSECCTFVYGNLSDTKSSEDTLLYFYVI